jgi:prepilin-type N-terminal cleavage/methylation domain-containing protein
MRKITSGFTMVEILVVIAVIGIITTISFISFGRYQSNTRDTQRNAKTTVLSEALEKYYDKNGEYPSCSALTGSAASVTTTVLPGVEPATLVAPQATSGITNSFQCTDLTNASTDPDAFAYIGDGSAACSTGAACLEFTLKYKDEATNTIKTITSRRTTNISTSGSISNLSASALTFTQIDLTWTAITNAGSYNVQRATDNAFTTGLVATTTTTASYSGTGLTPGTTYYFRVNPVAPSSTGAWSNTANASTPQLATPVGSAVSNSSSQLTFSWAAIPLATSYTVDYSTSAGFASPTTTTGITALNQVVTGLAAGTTLYFRVYAVATGDTSDPSATVQATTTVPVPTGMAAVTNSPTQITASWNTIAVATSYTLEYATNGSFTGSTSIPGIVTLNRAVTGLAQGQTYYFRVYALVGAVSSSASTSASATTTVTAPSGVSITTYRPGTVQSNLSGPWMPGFTWPSGNGNYYYSYANAGATCPGGTTAMYRWYGYYNADPAGTDPQYYGWTGYVANETTRWMVQPTSGYQVRMQIEMYCAGPNANSATSGVVASCAANPGTTVACTF